MRFEARSKPIIANAWVDRKTNARADGDDGDARRGVSPIAGRRAIATGRRARAERGADARARTWGVF
jgi:hypothetical protein